jgi:5'-3' exonuclease
VETNLILDGNYILSKNTFTLHKNNLLYGALYRSLENTINNYRKWYPFSNMYLVSDSKEKSWRKELSSTYKGTRKKDTDIDWEFVYNTYGEFKTKLKGIKVFESPHVEGDDFISYITSKANKKGQSNIIVSNDHDIKQILNYSADPLWINIMMNEMYNKEKVFMPKNYQIFLDKVSRLSNNHDIFALNDNNDFINLLDKFTNKCELHEVNPIESLIVKMISGDQSDNIKSVWSVSKNGKTRGIGAKGAKSIYDDYLLEFGEVHLTDPDLYENIADLICEKKKLSKSSIEGIVENIKKNVSLVDLRLDNFPQEIIQKMEDVYVSK